MNIIIVQPPAAPPQGTVHTPLVNLTLPEFVRGYYSGRREFGQGEQAGHPMTDTEVLDAIRTMVQDGALEDEGMLQFTVGSLLGWMSGNR